MEVSLRHQQWRAGNHIDVRRKRPLAFVTWVFFLGISGFSASVSWLSNSIAILFSTFGKHYLHLLFPASLSLNCSSSEAALPDTGAGSQTPKIKT